MKKHYVSEYWNIESYDWNDLCKKAEEFIHKYIPQASVKSNIKSFYGDHPAVEICFPEKGNGAALKKLNEEKGFKRLKGINVGGSRIGKGEIIFDPDGLLK